MEKHIKNDSFTQKHVCLEKYLYLVHNFIKASSGWNKEAPATQHQRQIFHFLFKHILQSIFSLLLILLIVKQNISQSVPCLDL